MSKKIVIMPTFCDAHIIKHQIPNIMDTINPDYIIYNEGMFPLGPESNTNVTEQFINEYTLDGHRGFDYMELKGIIDDNRKKYPDVNIILNEMNYPYTTKSAPACYTMACTNFDDLGVTANEGDYIFPMEGDVFHYQGAKDEISEYLKQLEPNTGFKSIWLDFIETQFYVEKKTISPLVNDGVGGRQRRVCVRFGDMEFLNGVLGNFMTQQYPMLYPTSLITFHYPWWKPEKYKELRYALINRDKSYWAQFDNGLNEIRKNGNEITDDVVIRPGSPINSDNRYAAFVDIEHPIHIMDHVNYIK